MSTPSNEVTGPDVLSIPLPQLPVGATYGPEVLVQPSLLPASTSPPREYSPFSRSRLTDSALDAQRIDSWLPAQSVAAEVKHLCSTWDLKIVVGSTGCGKSTQIPQLIAEHEDWSSADLANDGYPLLWVTTSRVKGCICLLRLAEY